VVSIGMSADEVMPDDNTWTQFDCDQKGSASDVSTETAPNGDLVTYGIRPVVSPHPRCRIWRAKEVLRGKQRNIGRQPHVLTWTADPQLLLDRPEDVTEGDIVDEEAATGDLIKTKSIHATFCRTSGTHRPGVRRHVDLRGCATWEGWTVSLPTVPGLWAEYRIENARARARAMRQGTRRNRR
jgi:hypothetical protein